MSGGSYDYAYSRVEELACAIRCDSPLRRAFCDHLRLVAKALHDIEWVDSYDTAPGSEDAAIRACLAPGAELASAIKSAELARDELNDAIERAKNNREVKA